MKILSLIFRIIFLPVALIFFMKPLIVYYFYWLHLWLRYGGEMVLFDNTFDKNSVKEIMRKLNEQKP